MPMSVQGGHTWIRVWRRLTNDLVSAGVRILAVLSRRPWIAAPCLLVFLPVAAAYLWLLFLPWPLPLRWDAPARTSFMEYRLEEAESAGKELSIQHTWVPLEAISPNLRRAVLAAEDDRFYHHHGIDWRALAEEVGYQGDTTFSWWRASDRQALLTSLVYAWENRGDVKGRSTLTQQLAKNLYFTPERSLLRKLEEAVVAKRLEFFLPKDRILELYLNLAEWGPGIFGAEAAARTYFGRSASELTLGQAASLAASLPHPLTSNPAYRPAQMEWRKALIFSRLQGPGAQADTAASALPPDTAISPPSPDTASGNR